MLLVGGCAVVLLAGCQTVKSPVAGLVYLDVQAPEGATSNSGSSKVGTATASSLFGLIGTGDASIDTAAKNGGITRIHHVDSASKSLLGIYSTYTVTVYGE